MSSHIKNKSVTMSMNTVSIPNKYVKVWKNKSELPLGVFPTFLNPTQNYKKYKS